MNNRRRKMAKSIRSKRGKRLRAIRRNSTSTTHMEPCALVNWLELPADVTASIIRRLNAVEILTSVQYVCSTWRHICRDPSMWRSIHCFYYYDDSNSNLYDLSKLYRFAVDLSSGGLLDLHMDFSDDDLFSYIIDRSKHLKRIHIEYSASINDIKLIEMAEKVPLLEELDISHSSFSSETIATVGRLCPRLHSFKFNARPSCSTSSDDEAFAIAKNMSGLRRLHLIGNGLSNVELTAILDACQHLESLDLRECSHVNLDEDLRRRCLEQIQDFCGPNDSTDDYPFKFNKDDEFLKVPYRLCMLHALSGRALFSINRGSRLLFESSWY